MKSVTYNKTLFISALACFCSCNGLLEIEPENNVSDQEVIVDQLSAEKALNGAYNGASRGLASSILAWNQAADNVVLNSNPGILIMRLSASSLPTRSGDAGYPNNYTAINRINSVIANVNNLSDNLFSGTGKQTILAQAYALRALIYINLTVTFGAVPIVTQPSTATNQIGIKQSPREQVFAQALNDLNQAESLFGSDNAISDRGRISLWAVYALKARLFLYTQQWEQAEEYASKIIGNTTAFGLTETPEGFFVTKKSRESIFEFVFSNANRLPFYTYYLPSTMNGLQDFVVSSDLANKLNDTQVGGNRRQLMLRRTQAETDQTYFVNEYSKGDGSSSIQTARLVEQYLIRAEARLKKTNPNRDGAIDDINVIKNRATVPLLGASTPLTNQDLLLVIEDERRYEHAFEGHRYFDIIRTGRAPQVFGIHEPQYLDSRFWVFPFAYSLLAYDSDLEQNEAYI